MEWRTILYALPMVPFVPRIITILKFPDATSGSLTEAVANREQHRSFILVMAGFSFTGLLGLAAAPLAITDSGNRATLQHALQLPTYFLLTSFLFYISALNLQGYKRSWRHDLLADALIDGAALSLLSSIIVLVWHASSNSTFTILIGLFAGIVWGLDEAIRTRLTWKVFRDKERKKKKGATA
jgi:hypothetical protein